MKRARLASPPVLHRALGILPVTHLLRKSTRTEGEVPDKRLALPIAQCCIGTYPPVRPAAPDCPGGGLRRSGEDDLHRGSIPTGGNERQHTSLGQATKEPAVPRPLGESPLGSRMRCRTWTPTIRASRRRSWQPQQAVYVDPHQGVKNRRGR